MLQLLHSRLASFRHSARGLIDCATRWFTHGPRGRVGLLGAGAGAALLFVMLDSGSTAWPPAFDDDGVWSKDGARVEAIARAATPQPSPVPDLRLPDLIGIRRIGEPAGKLGSLCQGWCSG